MECSFGYCTGMADPLENPRTGRNGSGDLTQNVSKPQPSASVDNMRGKVTILSPFHRFPHL